MSRRWFVIICRQHCNTVALSRRHRSLSVLCVVELAFQNESICTTAQKNLEPTNKEPAANTTVSERYFDGKEAVVLAYDDSNNEIAIIPLDEEYDKSNVHPSPGAGKRRHCICCSSRNGNDQLNTQSATPQSGTTTSAVASPMVGYESISAKTAK